MNIIFMGTPEFSVPSLRNLSENGHTILSVYTQPDKPKGRGNKLSAPPVKKFAVENSIKVFQPNSLRNNEVISEISNQNPDFIIVVAYGKILPKEILGIPKYGCVNLHGSLLPKYRGPSPIQQSILNGDKITGVTTMYMAEGIDTGDMILKSETKIDENETSDDLFKRLSEIGAGLLSTTIEKIANGSAPRIKQKEEEASYTSILKKESCGINFSETADSVHNKIRGLSSWPCATTFYKNKVLKVYKSVKVDNFTGKIGEILDKKRLIVACGRGAVELLEVQYDGSKKMKGLDFINGQKIKPGDFLE